MDGGNQPKKMKGLRSKRRPRKFPPLNTVSASAITAPVTVGNTISDYAPKKTKGLRSKRQPRKFPPLNAVSASPINAPVTIGNTISDYAPKKTKGLRSKRQPRKFPPLNAVSASPINAPVTVGNTISDYAPKKTKGLRSKRRPHKFLPPNAVSASAITAPVTVGNTISDYAPTITYTFSPLEVEVAEALVLLAHGAVHVSKSSSKSKPKMHECTVCEKFPSGQALGGHKRKHYGGAIIRKSAAGTVNSSPNARVVKKPKYN